MENIPTMPLNRLVPTIHSTWCGNKMAVYSGKQKKWKMLIRLWLHCTILQDSH